MVIKEEQLNEGQRALRDAVVDALLRGDKEVLMGGAAGSGKTTMLAVVAAKAEEIVSRRRDIVPDEDADDAEPPKVKIAAPTNRAAKMLNRKLPAPFKATTLHYLLNARPKEYTPDMAPEIRAKAEDLEGDEQIALLNLAASLERIGDLAEQYKAAEEAEDRDTADSLTVAIREIEDKIQAFNLGGGDLSDGDIVIVDEASMVHEDLREQTIGTGAQVVWVGDPFQLEPVKSECWFKPEPSFTLTKVMRQGGESGILKLATLCRKGHTDIRRLATALAGYTDVEFVFGSVDWQRLAREYPDKWLTWRNGFGTRAHPFHTKRLNEQYRYATGRYSELPEEGERLYVTEKYADRCGGYFLVKGDEVVTTTGPVEGEEPHTLSLHTCPAVREGFDRLGRRREKTEAIGCVCDSVKEETGTMPHHCDGRSGYVREDTICAHPWTDIVRESEGIRYGVKFENNAGKMRRVPGLLVDPEYLRWDQEQGARLYRLDRYYRDLAAGGTSRSPRAASLKATFAYCGSVHQAQGGEWPAVAVFWEARRGGKPDAAKWLYTAVTRASERLCIVVH